MIKTLNWNIDIEDFLGKKFCDITGAVEDSEYILFETGDGHRYKMYHKQDCCEDVRLEDVAGDIKDLLDEEILMAECVTNSREPARDEYDKSYTWTYYKLATRKGYVTLRWYGKSNGCYSEKVQIDYQFDEEYHYYEEN